MRVFHIVAPAEAGAAGDMTQRSIKYITAPACGVPAKYHFAGCPAAGATVSL